MFYKKSVLRNKRSLLYNWRCGKHSGFPVCCRIYYQILYTINSSWIFSKIYSLEWKYKKPLWATYKPCPLCFTRRNFIIPKWCDCGVNSDKEKYDRTMDYLLKEQNMMNIRS